MTPPSPLSAFSTAPSSPVTVHRSPWHSPVPYLFGGLAAMMALIAFALFILACSYWKISRRLQDNTGADPERDLEVGAGVVKVPDGKGILTSLFEEMFLVVMAGDEKPTFLATPSSSRTSSFGSNSCRNSLATTDDSSLTEVEKDESGDQVQVSTTGSHESAEHVS